MFRQYFWGILLIILGILFLLDTSGIVEIETVFLRYWPVLLILIGLHMILKKTNSSNSGEVFITDNSKSGKHHWSAGEPAAGQAYNNVFGDIKLSFEDQTVSTFSLSNVFGDIELDFIKARFTEKSLVKINGVFGDVHLRFPPDISVSGRVNFLAGTAFLFNEKHDGLFRNISFMHPSSAKKNPAIQTDISILFGDIHISG
ncbi:MAG: hypothetical protein EH225_13680 [Calditrichaeota bacterium]|nr:hypothetical protein [Calditrichota bacterium]RQV92305.1 MAG: hypothetical protein EH221_11740 [bacterium]RQV98134.1 MAG: hypothetical protein EH225_13680 [Calditrichota bacterium]